MAIAEAWPRSLITAAGRSSVLRPRRRSLESRRRTSKATSETGEAGSRLEQAPGQDMLVIGESHRRDLIRRRLHGLADYPGRLRSLSLHRRTGCPVGRRAR